MDTLTFLEDYWKTQESYEKLYGLNTIVLVEKGSFMECYGTETRGNVKVLSKILNMVLTKSNKNNELSDTNPYMSGFPTVSKSKNLPILLENDMYIVWKEQVKDENGNLEQRKVTRVFTPGTYVPQADADFTSDHNFLACVYKTGVCLLDVSLGCVYIRDYDTKENIKKILYGYQPRETILMNTEIANIDMFHTIEECNSYYYDKKYQQEVIRKIYNCNLHVCDLCPNATIAFIRLLDHLHICYPSSIESGTLDIPVLLEHMDTLLLHNNAVSQLNLLTNNTMGKKNSLFNIIDKTCTAIGHRKLKRLLIHPYTDKVKMNQSYKDIEDIKPFYKEIQCIFRSFPDLERIFQRFKLRDIAVNDVTKMIMGLNLINEKLPQAYKEEHVNELCDFLEVRFGFEQMNLVMKSQELERMTNKKETFIYDIHTILDKYNSKFYGKYKLKLDHQEKDGYFVSITNKKKEFLHMFKDITFSQINSTNSKLSTSVLDELCYHLTQLEHEYKHRYQSVLEEYINEFVSIYSKEVHDIIKHISTIDICASFANVAERYDYVCPEILDGTNSKIMARDVRHPIVEQLDVTYVTNDATFDKDNLGLLLYGINGSGKSCYGRSVALNLILAQIGSYVPAKSFSFTPYHQLFTRINCDDNMYEGQSSFFVEMNELLSIKQLATKNSIIIGDEMCKGTEDLSAIGLVHGAIEWMTKNDIQFIFATHLHKLQQIIDIPTVKIKHLKTEYNTNINKYVFHRKLEEGGGDSLYGLEIARQILNCPDIINKAMQTRNMLLGNSSNIVIPKKSRYNKKLFMDECKHCKSRVELHTHHIIYQKDDPVFKNKTNNLVNLCEKCHQLIHKDELYINILDVGDRYEYEFIFKKK